MDVNKIQIRKDGFVDKQVVIPIELTWDYLDMDQSINEYEAEIVKEVTGNFGDFEVSRFAHDPISVRNPQSNTNFELTDINYEFYFYSGQTNATDLNNEANWANNYIAEGFSPQEIYYYTNNFTNSFFKLDFYDSVDNKRQTNYFTVILPTQQGLTMTTTMQRTPNVSIKRPTFLLDYVGDKEGFFLYWLKKRNFLNLSTFYMTAKFYNSKTGVFVRMMNMPQSKITGDKYVFDYTKYFYYEVELDYDKQTYQVFNINPNQTIYGNLNNRAGTTIPIKWYEYVNSA
jgi:hypothetical protein